MTQKLTLFFALSLLAFGAMAQKESKFSGPKKPATFGIQFNLADFKAPIGIRTPGAGTVYSSVREMSKGLGLTYTKGINNKIDFAATLNGMFYDYPNLSSTVLSKKAFVPELQGALHIRPYGDNHLVAPYLIAGVGGAYVEEKFAAYAPLGFGVQVNLQSLTYITVQSTYRAALTTDNTDDNLFFSLGLHQTVGKEKKAEVTPPPAPVVETPKDTDGDGVIDADDKCPTVAGVASLQGCPDKDGDGIADSEDKCPDVAGIASLQGCPDKDGDGIADGDDKCPTVAGLARLQGCPIPDTDKDGVNDENDKCPTEAGPASNYGCPEVKQEIVERINRAAKNIYYATGSEKILAKSFKSLNEVVSILQENNSLNLTIDGHTDNTGNEDKNQSLSERRAASVKAYLVSKGIAEGRLTSNGYGSSKPAAVNTTAAGRAQNRRVEMVAKNY
jgi:OmpA-OmpF porin, OOP family